MSVWIQVSEAAKATANVFCEEFPGEHVSDRWMDEAWEIDSKSWTFENAAEYTAALTLYRDTVRQSVEGGDVLEDLFADATAEVLHKDHFTYRGRTICKTSWDDGLGWYVVCRHPSGIAFDEHACPQYRTAREAMDAIAAMGGDR